MTEKPFARMLFSKCLKLIKGITRICLNAIFYTAGNQAFIRIAGKLVRMII